MQETQVWSLIWEDPRCCREVCAPQLLNLCSRAQELQLLKPSRPRTRSLQQEKPPQWEACIPQLDGALAHSSHGRAHMATETQHSQKIISESNEFIKLLDFRSGSDGKASAYNVGDLGSIPGSGRSSREGSGSPLQYSCLENPIDGGTW